MFDSDIINLGDMLKEAERAVFFGGAGVSTASGIPDFRSATGIYSKQQGAENILTPGFMRRHPEDFWKFYREYFMIPGIKPNACHYCVADLEKQGHIAAVVTQNVDGLHQQAGSKCVYELHGTTTTFSCLKCRKKYSFDEVMNKPLIPHCDDCDGVLRPDIVLYQEGLPTSEVNGAVRAIEDCDLLIVGGTSLTVYPAAGMIYLRRPGVKLVLCNLGETAGDGHAELIIRRPIDEVFKEVADYMQESA